jgi:HD-like signal output (HDOD) protein
VVSTLHADTRNEIKKLKEIPTLPVIITKIVRIMHDEKASVQDLVEIIKHDQSLVSRILAVANTPFFGCRGKINSIDQAILMLGFDLVKSIAVSISIFSIFPVPYPVMKRMWSHAYKAALLAGVLSLKIPDAHNGVCFLAGLLHDIGRVVLITLQEYRYYRDKLQTMSSMKSNNLLLWEKEIFKCTHAEAGGVFLEDLLLPPEVFLPVYHHHDHSVEDIKYSGVITDVFLAEGLLSRIGPDSLSDGEWTADVERVFIENGFSMSDIDDYALFLTEQEYHIESFFEL